MQGKLITYGLLNKVGRVMLVYTEAIASGTADYTAYTMLLVSDGQGNIEKVYPRDVVKVEVEFTVPPSLPPVHLPNVPYDPKWDRLDQPTLVPYAINEDSKTAR